MGRLRGDYHAVPKGVIRDAQDAKSKVEVLGRVYNYQGLTLALMWSGYGAQVFFKDGNARIS